MITELIIKGMTCEHCVRHVTEGLEEVSGVISVKVSLEDCIAIIEHGKDVDINDLVFAVEEAGYEVG